MKKFLLGSFFFVSTAVFGITPEIALQKLIEGNTRFVANQSMHCDASEERRLETAHFQEPFAVVLGCSDSRVAPEIIFDQGIGDLFIVRVAGNVVAPVELDSIEYSALYLHSSIIVVLGHESCGAIKAVLEGNTKDIEDVAKLIIPAVKKSKGQPGDKWENATKENVRLVTKQLKKSTALKKLIKDGKLNIVGGYYNFHTGRVELL